MLRLWSRTWQQLLKYSAESLVKRHYTANKNIPVLTLFTKDQCPLCDAAKEVLEPYRHRFVLQEVDITLPDNAVWYDRYKYDIPVFHLNGQFLMMHQINHGKLENELSRLEREHEGK
ncbi:glutaredoxin-like protein C5orf63 homolog [Microcaecilia unicolor]|uniref:Glutaredoxin-like protein n=1 Tax=Microcaecilia unicolor TaxID=1415580 RepID=A0A6P7XFK9_9AMPH|nr:glutaredoxin-like protein C5orf63 homolog [Microcaecilia unicolor]